MANRLEVKAHIVDETLYLNYGLTNTTGQALYLFNVLPPRAQDANYSTEFAYTSFWPTPAAQFLQGWLPYPTGNVYLTVPAIPGATRLRANQRYEGTIRVPLPLREWHNYAGLPDERTPTRTVVVDYATLLLDTLLDGDKFAEPTTYEALPGVYWVNGDPITRLRADVKLPESLSLLLRQDDFARFPPERVA